MSQQWLDQSVAELSYSRLYSCLASFSPSLPSCLHGCMNARLHHITCTLPRQLSFPLAAVCLYRLKEIPEGLSDMAAFGSQPW